MGNSLQEGLELLSRVGLNDAFLFIRRYSQLSDGQKYRYRIDKLIETSKQYWVMDEFCYTLDRNTAKILRVLSILMQIKVYLLGKERTLHSHKLLTS